MKSLFLSLLFLVGVTPSIISQEQESTEEPETQHLISASFGYTFIPKATEIGGTEAKGVFVPSIGFDYFYRIAPKWEIGTMIDLELSDYLILEKDLEREKALVVAVLGAYKLTKHINVFAGGGIELENHHNLAVFRFGTEYIHYFNNGWILGPAFFYDIKEGYDTWSLAVAFGKEF
tara:strand:+ start:68171 stop:68698 length:528 start_codon:yes stop_codon:yes gene_type:complete